MKMVAALNYYLGFIASAFPACAEYHFSGQDTALSPPSLSHWCGTGVLGEDILFETIVATGIEVSSLILVSVAVWFLGLVLGWLSSMPSGRFVRELLMFLIHFLATIPVLLLALFLLILFGGGYLHSVVILIIAALPSQVFFAYNHFEQAKKEDFYLAKRSYGLSDFYVFKNHLFPFIIRDYNRFTFSRMPEIMMMSLALNYLGLGVKSPAPTLGKMLFDGLSFMFSAWWIWVFPVVSLIFVFSIIMRYGKE